MNVSKFDNKNIGSLYSETISKTSLGFFLRIRIDMFSPFAINWHNLLSEKTMTIMIRLLFEPKDHSASFLETAHIER